MPQSTSHSSAPASPSALGVAAACAAWVAVLLVLNITVQPLVSGAAFAGLALLAWKTGHRRLIVISLAVGVGLLIIVPGVSLSSGTWSFTFGEQSQWLPPATPLGVMLEIMSALRVPAQVLSVVLLALVPAAELVQAMTRVSPRSALLGGLAARMRPLLQSDASAVLDELNSRGLAADRTAPMTHRLQSAGRLWASLVAGSFDRAQTTAQSLAERGYGVRNPTTEQLADPALRSAREISARLDRVILINAVGLTALVIVARATKLLVAPNVQLFSGIHDPVNPAVVVAAVLAAGIGVIPALRLHEPRNGLVVAGPALAPGTEGEPAGLDVGPVDTLLRELHPEGASAGVALDAHNIVVTAVRSGTVLLTAPSVTIEAGAFVVVHGPSGSGKSTLLEAITGGLRERGDLVVSGTVRGLDADAPWRTLATVRQDPRAQSIFDLVVEDVAFALRNQRMSAHEISRRVTWALSAVGCAHLVQRRTTQVSGGELQRIMLAAALARRPKLLVLDEPTAELDAATGTIFWAAVDALRQHDGTTVIVVEHDLRHVRSRATSFIAVGAGLARQSATIDGAASADDALTVTGSGLVIPAWSAAPRLVASIPVLRSRSVPQRTLARDISLVLPPGAGVVITGPNGSGKSTVLSTIRGLVPVAHSVVIDGMPRGPVQSSGHLVSWMSQHAASMVLADSVVEHVSLAPSGHRISRPLVHAALVDAGLATRAADHPSELSVGERERLAVLCATIHGPPVWLLDEPSRGMDSQAVAWLIRRINAHRRAGGVVIIATHDERLRAVCASHELALADGRADLALLGSAPAPRPGFTARTRGPLPARGGDA